MCISVSALFSIVNTRPKPVGHGSVFLLGDEQSGGGG